jgi:hypothetical protein
MPKISPPFVATIVPLSMQTRALVIEGRELSIIRGREVWTLPWAEVERLTAVLSFLPTVSPPEASQ